MDIPYAAVQDMVERARALDAIAAGWAAMLEYVAGRGLQPADRDDRDPEAYETDGDYHIDGRYVYPRRMWLLEQVVRLARGEATHGLVPLEGGAR